MSVTPPDEPDDLVAELRAGSRRALAQAITLIESTRADHRRAGDALLARIGERAEGIRIGISGAPGVGKSTFIEIFGQHVIRQGHRVAVLAVDPTSRVSGGSILGDKTRMQQLARSESAFVRPTPAGASLGGVAARTRECVLLCEAAGYDVVMVETVGVGQSEVEVADMTDLFMLLIAPAGGDDLQGIKRGIMELADLVVVNKSDGDLMAAAGRTAADFKNALRLMRPRTPGWSPTVVTCSSITGEGVAAVWDAVCAFVAHVRGSGELEARRTSQRVRWFRSQIARLLEERVRSAPQVAKMLPGLEAEVRQGRLSASGAAEAVVAAFIGGGADAERDKQ